MMLESAEKRGEGRMQLRSVIIALAIGMNTGVFAGGFDDASAAYGAKDYRTAFSRWMFFAEKGSPDAQYNIGLMYFYGQGVRQDYAQAAKWYLVSAQQGDAYAQNNIGMMYHQGYGVPQDYYQALKWYRLAAEQGLGEAQHNLARYYHKGKSVLKDHVQAHAWFNLAAMNGAVNAAQERDALAEEMTPRQIEEAQKFARDCLSRDYKGC